ncbi:MAG: ATP-dependent zinc metalloprotease FtsH [Elusimicrobia bacterium]|jgi:cell division protease FtsH|nr:ATP-dependent zinc metalloprotease FtsH [Elusimicrobiota bacterium]
MTKPKNNNKNKIFKSLSFWVFIFIGAILISNYVSNREKPKEITYSDFRIKLQSGRVRKAKVGNEKISGTYTDAAGNAVEFETITVTDPDLVKELQESGVVYEGEISEGWLKMLIFNFGPILLFIVIWFVIINQMRSGGKSAMKFGKSKAKLNIKSKDKKDITFNDVAGVEESKEELEEIIEFLRNPKKFTKLGAEIPKGVLLYGAPGTGKTLLAKAVAGEADVPFFSTSGSEFVQMFVGVGASRIRDLFDKGRKNAPCLLFIDELDAVGQKRFSGVGGGNDEREQTLNQMLTELDGFDAREGVILIGATNRPDVLDKALLRKGRFDRLISVLNPDVGEREEILKLHGKKVKLSDEIDFELIARRTPGFVGSDLANIVNEGALLAAREGKKKVNMHHIEEAVDRVIAGPEKKSRVISDEEKKKIAYHESGHTLVALNLKYADPVHKVSILSRGPALGYTLQLPLEDRYLTSEEEILDKLSVLLAGRAAEELIFNSKTTGAQNDLRKSTEMAYKLVTEFGMSAELGPLAFQRDRENMFLGKDLSQGREYSEKTAQLIDEGVLKIIKKAHKKARDVLEKNRDVLIKLAEELIVKEIIESDEIKKIVGIDYKTHKTKKTLKSKEGKKKKENKEDKEAKKNRETKKMAEKKKKDEEKPDKKSS